MQLQPYLFFEGRCEEALDFYRQALGAEVTMLLRYKDSPQPENNPPGLAAKVMHANLRIGDAVFMASDGMCREPASFTGFALSLTPASVAEAERFFAALSAEGEVRMPLAKTFWSPCFGMVADRFGVLWMVGVMAEPTGQG